MSPAEAALSPIRQWVRALADQAGGAFAPVFRALFEACWAAAGHPGDPAHWWEAWAGTAAPGAPLGPPAVSDAVLRDPAFLGWAYHEFLLPRKQAVSDAKRRPGQKVGPEAVVSATALYTPRWIVRYLVQPLRKQPLPILDPACGSGHFLLEILHQRVAASDTPIAAWEEGLAQLQGVDIDEQGIQLARLAALLLHPNPPPSPKGAPALREQLEQAFRVGDALEQLPRRVPALVMNPPYLDKGDMTKPLRARLRGAFPKSYHNLFAAFLEQALEVLAPEGYLAAIVPQPLLFLKSYLPLRERLLQEVHLDQLVHLGLEAFDGATVDTVMFRARRRPCHPQPPGQYLRLVEAADKPLALARLEQALSEGSGHPDLYRCDQEVLRQLPGQPMVYWLPEELHALFRGPALGQLAAVKSGIDTGSAGRFIRYRWEVPASAIGPKAAWVPYCKGGPFRPFSGNLHHVVRWDPEAMGAYPGARLHSQDYFFREGITFTRISSKGFSARHLPSGHIFDHAGSAIFCQAPDQLLPLLAWLNSTVAGYLLKALNPTLNFQAGDLRRLPVPEGVLQDPVIRRLSEAAVKTAQGLDAWQDPSCGVGASLWNALDRSDGASLTPQLEAVAQERVQQLERMQALRHQLNQVMLGLVGANPGTRSAVTRELSRIQTEGFGKPPTVSELAMELVEGRAMGAVHEGDLLPLATLTANLHKRLGSWQAEVAGLLGRPLTDWLDGPLFQQHVRRFRRRPVLWHLTPKSGPALFVHAHHIEAAVTAAPERFPRGYAPRVDDGVKANLHPLQEAGWLRYRRVV